MPKRGATVPASDPSCRKQRLRVPPCVFPPLLETGTHDLAPSWPAGTPTTSPTLYSLDWQQAEAFIVCLQDGLLAVVVGSLPLCFWW